MQLNNFKSSWQHIKVLNAMQPLESKDILAIVEDYENGREARFQTTLFNIVLFVVITFFFQGG